MKIWIKTQHLDRCLALIGDWVVKNVDLVSMNVKWFHIFRLTDVVVIILCYSALLRLTGVVVILLCYSVLLFCSVIQQKIRIWMELMQTPVVIHLCSHYYCNINLKSRWEMFSDIVLPRLLSLQYQSEKHIRGALYRAILWSRHNSSLQPFLLQY